MSTDKRQLHRAPYILAHPGDQSGCGHHRVFRPVEWLTKTGMMAARIEMNFVPDNILVAMNPDVVVWQRQNEEHQIEVMQRYRALLPETFMVYEVDDALSAIPEQSYHKPYMDAFVDRRMARAIGLCDVVTVTTDALAEHMRGINSDVPIRVAPNMLSQADLDQVAAVQKQLPPRQARKLRIGWGGGAGHKGDLALLNNVFVTLKDEVEWVFLGYLPPLPEGTPATFAGAASPQEYLRALAAIDVDLIVAPLEENLFNRCKSNLRLLEAGACSYPVIASSVAPYLTHRPPVYAYANTPDEWVAAIRKFAALSASGRAQFGAGMHKWLKRHYLVDTRIKERCQAWLPDNVVAYQPRDGAPGRGYTVAGERDALIRACETGTKDVIYVRQGVEVDSTSLNALVAHCTDPLVASVSTVSNDGGPAGFPMPNQFSQVTDEFILRFTELCARRADTAPLPVASGPVVLLRHAALRQLGSPNFGAWSVPELALLEWSLLAAARGMKNVVDLSVFAGVLRPLNLAQTMVEQASQRLSARWPTPQVDPAPLTRFRQELELQFHRENYRTPQPRNRGDYPLWTKVNDSMGPKSMEAMFEWYSAKPRPTVECVFYGAEPLSIEAMRDTPTDWKIFLPEGAIPAMALVGYVCDAIEKHPDALIFYGDHDHVDANGVRGMHDFKPHFDQHLLLSRDYVTQALIVKSTLLERALDWKSLCGWYDQETARQQLYNIVVCTALNMRLLIKHIPRILAHLPPFDQRAEETASVLNAKAAQRTYDYIGSVTIKQMPQLRLYHEVSYHPPADQPKVAIVIPTKNNLPMLGPCLATILAMTTYKNFEVLVVVADNGNTNLDMLEYQQTHADFKDPRVRLLHFDEPYNWAALNNWAVEQTDAAVYCFLNDDTRVMEPEWLNEMVGAACFPNSGAIGARLTYPHGACQHAGVVYAQGLSGHMHKGLAAQSAGYNGIVALSHEATAVTGACMVVRRERFDEVGGFDEHLPYNFNDVAFCLEMGRRGYVNVVAARAHLQHFEGVTRPSAMKPEGQAIMLADGRYMAEHYPEGDRYWNPNFMFFAVRNGQAIGGLNMDTFLWPPPAAAWERKEIERIIVVGDENLVAPEVRDGAVLFKLLVQGNLAQLIDPPMHNIQPFDLRDPQTARDILENLGVHRIVVTALENGSTLLLSFLVKLGIPVTYRPVDAEAACPRRNLQPSVMPCDGGWRAGACQGCIDMNGSPNGYVTLDAWRAEWRRFMACEHVETQLDFVALPAYREAVNDVYGAKAVDAA